MTYILRILLLQGLVLVSMSAYADDVERLPKWELGAGLAAASFPDYPGSDQNRSLVLPYPSVIYRGSRISAACYLKVSVGIWMFLRAAVYRLIAKTTALAKV